MKLAIKGLADLKQYLQFWRLTVENYGNEK